MRRKQDPQSITSANEPLSTEQARRTKAYLIQMAIRVSCISAALFIGGPTRWVLVAMAVILPYVAVVKVNLGRANNQNLGNPMEYYQLEAEREERDGLGQGDGSTGPKSDSQEP